MIAYTHWLFRSRPDQQPRQRSTADLPEKLVLVVAALLLCHLAVRPWLEAVSTEPPPSSSQSRRQSGSEAFAGREILLAFYAGLPFYYRSDVHLQQPGGTDVTLKRLGWDGDPFYFPIDGGIRSVEWWGSTGVMVDFLHNKAIARLGRGSHGRKISNPVIESVETSGRIAGKPAPSPLKLTDMFERFEFTHGHNMLFFTPLLRLAPLSPTVRPYVGVGGGIAVPHVEVWSPNTERDDRTNEYQFGGPAVQGVAGLELRLGRASYFVEYKFSFAWISGALTGEHSWLNFNMPGDLWRQTKRWWRGEEPRYGRFSTTLGAHQVVFGGGYWVRPGRAKP